MGLRRGGAEIIRSEVVTVNAWRTNLEDGVEVPYPFELQGEAAAQEDQPGIAAPQQPQDGDRSPGEAVRDSTENVGEVAREVTPRWKWSDPAAKQRATESSVYARQKVDEEKRKLTLKEEVKATFLEVPFKLSLKYYRESRIFCYAIIEEILYKSILYTISKSGLEEKIPL